jgi:DNA-binding GntR family transcriptional regulator
MTRAAFVRPPTAQQAVHAALRREILSGELRPGQAVPQEAVASRFGVSRVPVREALKILEGEGLVTYAPHRGYAVAELSVDDLVEVYRIRTLLEGEAVRAAVPRLTDDDLERLAVLTAECEAADQALDVTTMTAANRDLHFALFELAGLPRLVRLLGALWDATDVYRSVYYADADSRAVVVAEHREVLEALRRRDASLAVAVLDEHRQHAIDHVRWVLEPAG